MKKSKILAPALALTIFSTAAAVTGTVAWYFAQRAVSIKAAVTSFNPEAGLKVTLTADAGTTVSNAVSTSTATPATISHELIRDGSVDLENEKVYGTNLNRAGTTITEFDEIDAANEADKLLAGEDAEGNDYYYATKYTAKFELTQKKTNIEYALYYDNANLSHGTGTSSVQEALRIGIINENGDFFVIAPFRSAAPTEGIQYVKDADPAEDRGDYAVDGKVLYGFTTALAQSGDTYNATTSGTPADNLDGLEAKVDAGDEANYLGYIGNLINDDTHTVTVYTWFEGEDPHSDSKYVDNKSVETTLSFTLLEVNQ